MKKLFSAFIALSIFGLISFESQAQIWKDLGKKVSKKVEQQADRRLERKIDKTIDKAFDKAEEATEIKKKEKPDKTKDKGNDSAGVEEGASEDVLNILKNIGNEPERNLPSAYNFSTGITYEMSNEGKKDNRMKYTMWLPLNEMYVGMEMDMQKDMFMVLEDGYMTNFMLSQKKYMSIGGVQDAVLDAVEEQSDLDEDMTNMNFKKLGKENILGYSCDIYLTGDNENSTKIWIAQGVDSRGMFGAFSRMVKNVHIPENMPLGMMLKMENKDLKTGDVYRMEATEIHKEGKVFNTAGFTSLMSR